MFSANQSGRRAVPKVPTSLTLQQKAGQPVSPGSKKCRPKVVTSSRKSHGMDQWNLNLLCGSWYYLEDGFILLPVEWVRNGWKCQGNGVLESLLEGCSRQVLEQGRGQQAPLSSVTYTSKRCVSLSIAFLISITKIPSVFFLCLTSLQGFWSSRCHLSCALTAYQK